MHKTYLVTAAWLGALTVALGAFGAHALKEILPLPSLNTYETAIRYQFYHVFALALTGILYKTYPHKWIKTAGTLFILGIVFFCGSLYLLTCFAASGITGFNWVGAITPLGGLLLILGWILLGAGILRTEKQ
jgi:uncharacterized membrane protein YgdD (TMEM256/DUF423 family)